MEMHGTRIISGNEHADDRDNAHHAYRLVYSLLHFTRISTRVIYYFRVLFFDYYIEIKIENQNK